MIIRCTSKLLELVGVSPTDATPSEDDWYANVVRIGRVQCLMLTHVGTRLTVLAFRFGKVQARGLGAFAAAAIQRALTQEGFPGTVLGDLDGTDAIIARSASRSVLATMNQFAQTFGYVASAYPNGLSDLDIDELNRDLGRHLTTVDGDYHRPIDLVAARAGTSPQPLGPRIVRSSLVRRWPVIEFCLVSGRAEKLQDGPGRVFVAPPSTKLAKLGTKVDESFGRWDLAHLHVFKIEDRRYMLGGNPDEPGWRNSEYTSLEQAGLCHENTRFTYEFDLGDSWIHECRVVELVDPESIFNDPFSDWLPSGPYALMGWGTLPDQYGRDSPPPKE